MAGHGPLAAALLTDSLGDGLFLPFGLVYFLKTTSLGLPVIGLSLSAAGFAAVAAVPASGQLVDRFTAAPVVVAGNLVSAAAFTGYLAVGRAWQLAGLAFLAAAGGRLFWTANLALVGDMFGATERTRWFAFQRTMRNAGFGLGGVAGAVAVAGGSPAGYRLLAAANAASFALAALLMLRWSRRHKGKRGKAGRDGQRPGGQGGYRAALADRRFLRLTAVNLLFVLAMMAPEVLLTVYLVRDLHRPAWLAGVLFSLSTALVVTCQTALSRAAGRLRPGAVLRLAAGGWEVSFLLLWVLDAIPAAAVVPGAVTAIVIFTGAEMLQGPVLNALVVAAAPIALRGRYLAVYQLSWALGRAAAPGALSWLLAIGPGWPWAALTATCAACALLLRGRRTPSAPPTGPRPPRGRGNCA
jgi:MFS family permease